MHLAPVFVSLILQHYFQSTPTRIIWIKLLSIIMETNKYLFSNEANEAPTAQQEGNGPID